MMKQMVKDDKNITIFQQNAITEARYELSSLQKNIFYLLLLKLKPGDSLKSKYKISIREINSSRNIRVRRSELYNASQSLMKLHITLYDEEEKGFKTLSILTSADYGDDGNEDDIIVEFDAKLYPYLIDVQERFTVFSLQNALNLKSKYSKRIYEMLCQFRSSGWFKISVRELKERFKLIDSTTGKEKYHEFSDFAKNVLEPARREINANTDITFKYTTELKGRKIEKILFEIEKIKGQEDKKYLKALAASTQGAPQPSSLEERVHKQCEDVDLTKKVVNKFPAEEIEWVMKGILKKHDAREIESLVGYSTHIFNKWLKGSKPTFEKTDIRTKHIPLKSASQTNQISVLENEIKKKLEYGFGLEYHPTVYNLIVNYGGKLESLEVLQVAISKVEETLERKEIERNQKAIYEALISQLVVKIGHSNQPLVAQSNERLNSTNSLGNILASSITKPNMQAESAEEEEIRKEKTGIWQELIGRFEVDDEKAHVFVEEYCVEALNYSISKVVEVLKKHKIPQDPDIIAEELRKYASLWKP